MMDIQLLRFELDLPTNHMLGKFLLRTVAEWLAFFLCIYRTERQVSDELPAVRAAQSFWVPRQQLAKSGSSI
jgi:hypothetical protein